MGQVMPCKFESELNCILRFGECQACNLRLLLFGIVDGVHRANSLKKLLAADDK